MSTSTLSPGDQRQDEDLNPGQQDYNRRVEAINGTEHKGTVDMSDFENNYNNDADSTQEDENIEKARNKEREGAVPNGINQSNNNTAPAAWKTSFNNNKAPKGKLSLASMRKRGGILGFLALFGIGGIGITGSLGVLTYPINIMENLTFTNDSSSTSFQKYFLNAFGYNTKDTDPVCLNSTKNIKCKMGRISNKAIDQLAKKGVIAYDANGPMNTGKKSGYPSKNPTGYSVQVNGKTVNIAAKDLPGYLNKNPKIAAKVLGTGGAFNLRVKAWSGKHITNKFYSVFKMNKKGGLADGQKRTGTATEKYNETIKKVREKIPGLEGLNSVTNNVSDKVKGQLDKTRKGGVAYTLAVAGCIAVKAPGYIAAGAAAVQLAQTIPIVNENILKPGSKFKASGIDLLNNATVDDAEAVGDLMTKETLQPDGKMAAANDSELFLAALGVNKGKPEVSTDFTPGYSILTNKAVVQAAAANKASESSCNAIMSPAAMYSALAVDSATTIIASTTIVGGIIKVLGSIAISELAIYAAGEVVKDVAAEAITELATNDKIPLAEGKQFGDLLGVSALNFFSAGGAARHLPTLSTSQAKEFMAMEAENQQFQREMDIASLSPFDISSQYTFLGSIIYNMNMGAIANGTYGTGLFSVFTNLARLPFSNLSQNTSAATELSASYCGYAEEFGLLTDNPEKTPCVSAAGTPRHGLTVEQAGMSTEEAITLLEGEGWLDTTVEVADDATIDDLMTSNVIKENTPLSDFIETCSDLSTGDYLYNTAGCMVDSETKSTDIAVKEIDSNGCFLNEAATQVCVSDSGDYNDLTTDGVKNPRSLQAITPFLLAYQITQSVNGDDEGTSTSQPLSSAVTTDAPANTIERGEGWSLKENTDYSSTECAAGSTDNGIYKHPTEGFTFRKCTIEGVDVNSLVSQNVVAMLAAAKADNIPLAMGNSFRSYEQQIAVRAKNCRGNVCKPPTATPGNSQHERGLAIDFASCDKATSQCFQWLKINAVKFGYYNLPSEPWHWSVSGN